MMKIKCPASKTRQIRKAFKGTVNQVMKEIKKQHFFTFLYYIL